MTRPADTPELRALRTLARRIAVAESAQRRRFAERYDLAAKARAAGASWTAINAAAGVANMQATLNGRRPE